MVVVVVVVEDEELAGGTAWCAGESPMEEDGAKRGVAMGVAAGDGATAYMPFSSSTTGPSTIQMSHTRCKPFWPACVWFLLDGACACVAEEAR